MISYKVLLDERRIKAGGKYPVVVRVTHDRKTSYFYLEISLNPSQWDYKQGLVTKNNPNYKELNKAISTKFLYIQKIILKLEDDKEFSLDRLKNELHPKEQAKIRTTFYDFSSKLIEEMIEVKRSGNAIVYQTAVNRVINYCGNKGVTFAEINYSFLNDFKHKLILDGVKQNTIGNYFRSIRAIYNKAIKAKIVERSCYPFYDISIKQEKTVKRAIAIADIKKIASLKIPKNSPIWHARNYFLLSFSLIGISFTDLVHLKPENLVNGRVIFKRRKTHKYYNIKLNVYAESIISEYNGNHPTYLFPILPEGIIENSMEAKKKITQALKTNNKYLKRLGQCCGLNSPLTTYVARHTWATIAKKLGYSNELIAEAMGHEYGNKITNTYLDNFDKDVIDEMHDKVIQAIQSNEVTSQSKIVVFESWNMN